MDAGTVSSFHKRMAHVRAAVMLSVALASANVAHATVINFEGLLDGTDVATQYTGLGVTFANAQAITSGLSLNEFEFPPHSGVNVVYDTGSGIRLSFASPVTQLGGFFTYATRLTLLAFDSQGTQIASASSLFVDNLALSGSPGASPMSSSRS